MHPKKPNSKAQSILDQVGSSIPRSWEKFSKGLRTPDGKQSGRAGPPHKPSKSWDGAAIQPATDSAHKPKLLKVPAWIEHSPVHYTESLIVRRGAGAWKRMKDLWAAHIGCYMLMLLKTGLSLLLSLCIHITGPRGKGEWGILEGEQMIPFTLAGLFIYLLFWGS